MPHIIVEHTKKIGTDLDLSLLNKELHKCLSQQDTVNLPSIKTRSIEVANAIVGDGKSNDFVHINVLLLTGRSDELKKIMAEKLFDVASTYIKDFHCLLSVNIDELGIYKK